jgi:uncharacterized protein YndB with AHSA1/START domain
VSESIQRKIVLPYSPEEVWQEIATDTGLAEWMYPNDFVAKVGHPFTFHVPPNPSIGFEGIEVRCEVLECIPPKLLVFSWSAGAPVENTRVSFRLEPIAEGTCLHLEHSGFDLDHPYGRSAMAGAKYGWDSMLERLLEKVAAKRTHEQA